MFQNTLIKRFIKYINLTSQRSGQPGVNAQEYAEFMTFMPQITEQIKIGKFFRQFDNLITFHGEELEKLKNMKKSLLEKMFV